MSDIFRNANGSLTMYALTCGYVETNDVPGGRFTVRLSADGCYHVKVRDARLSSGLAAWETYDTLTAARKAVRQAIRYYKGRTDTEPTERDTRPDAPAPWAE